MKSLKVIQVLAKIAWVLCRIVFVVCIVGAAASVVGLSIFHLVQNVKINAEQTVAQLIEEQHIRIPEAYAGMGIALLSCGVGIFLAKYNELFFKKEIDERTPFKREIVKQMKTVAIVNILVSLALGIIAATAMSIVLSINHLESINRGDFSLFSTVGFGISLLIISLFCDYGAEVSEHKEEVSEHKEPEEIK